MTPTWRADAVQETGLRFIKQVEGFRGDSQIRTWALGIAINVVQETKRRQARQRTGVAIDAIDRREQPGDHAPLPPAASELGEACDAAAETLSALPDRRREAVVLRYLDDLSVEETARVMGCATGTVKATVHRGGSDRSASGSSGGRNASPDAKHDSPTRDTAPMTQLREQLRQARRAYAGATVPRRPRGRRIGGSGGGGARRPRPVPTVSVPASPARTFVVVAALSAAAMFVFAVRTVPPEPGMPVAVAPPRPLTGPDPLTGCAGPGGLPVPGPHDAVAPGRPRSCRPPRRSASRSPRHDLGQPYERIGPKLLEQLNWSNLMQPPARRSAAARAGCGDPAGGVTRGQGSRRSIRVASLRVRFPRRVEREPSRVIVHFVGRLPSPYAAPARLRPHAGGCAPGFFFLRTRTECPENRGQSPRRGGRTRFYVTVGLRAQSCAPWALSPRRVVGMLPAS